MTREKLFVTENNSKESILKHINRMLRYGLIKPEFKTYDTYFVIEFTDVGEALNQKYSIAKHCDSPELVMQ